MECIVLGSGTSVPNARRSSSGYWLETVAGSLLLDCSASAVHRMGQEGCDWADLDAVWISHFHLDHCGGLAPLLFGTKYAHETQSRTKPMRIFGPVGIGALLDAFDAAYDYGLRKQPFPLEVIEVAGGKKFEPLDGVSAATFSTPHTEESCAIRVSDASGASMVFSADTGYSTNLGVFARDTDLLLIECSFVDEKPVTIHLNISDVEKIQKFARARQVVLTHLYPEFDGRENEVSELLAGTGMQLAHDGMRIKIERG